MKRKNKVFLSVFLCVCIFLISVPSGLAENEIPENTIETGEAVQLLIKYRNLDDYQFELNNIKRTRNKNYVSIETNTEQQWDLLQLDTQEDAEYYLNRLSEIDLCLYIDYYQGQTISWQQIQLIGDGSVNNPYQIFTESDLRSVAIYNNADYKLMSNIELTQPWDPVETYAGTFNGNGHTISNISFQSQEESVGFFNQLYKSAYIINTNFIYNNTQNLNFVSEKSNGKVIGCTENTTSHNEIISETNENTQLDGNNFTTSEDNKTTAQKGMVISEINNSEEAEETGNTSLTSSVISLSGEGTSDNPYQIYNKYDLNAVRSNLGACYKQMADITFDDSDYLNTGDFYNDGFLFLPIGGVETSDNSTGAPFTGKYDGNGFKISNLKMNGYNGTTGLSKVGLFGNVKKVIDSDLATLQNIVLESANIQPDMDGGGLTYEINNATITRCIFDGELFTPTGGAICYSSYNSVIEQCMNTGTINAFNTEGAGIVCSAASTLIDQCINKGLVIGGDLAGIIYWCNTSVTIRDSYNAGTINGENALYISGIAFQGDNIINCYNAGTIIPSEAMAEYDEVGAIGVQLSSNQEQIQNNYYLKNGDIYGTENGDIPGKITPLTEAQMKQQSSFTGFDFNNIWEIDPTAEYPYPTLKWINESGASSEETYENATIICADQNVESSLANDNSLDWYCFKPKYNNLYRINLSGSPSLEVYEYVNNELIPVTVNTTGLSMGYNEIFYIKISGTGTYTLGIESVNPKTNTKAFETKIGNDTYYSNLADGGKLYKNNTIVSNATQYPVTWLCTDGNSLYYCAQNGIYKLTGDTSTIIKDQINASYLTVDENTLYFSNNFNNGKLYKISKDGTGLTLICHDSAAWIKVEGSMLTYLNRSTHDKKYQISKTASNEGSGQEI